MQKAFATTKYESAFGELTVVVTEAREIYFRAHEAAKLFGFSDTKRCLRQYAENAELIIMSTSGGKQPVKCIPLSDLMLIGFKSSLKGKDDLLHELTDFHKCVKIEILEWENDSLKALLNECNETLEESMDQTKRVLKLLDDSMLFIETLLNERQISMNQ